MSYIIVLLTIFVSMSGISAEIAENILKSETKVCETNVSPLTLGVNVCPITDEEFDEDDLIECTCVLPSESSESFQKLKNKKIGDVFKNMFNESKKSFVDVVRVASQSGIRADHPENNKCSMDAFSEILKNRLKAPKQSSIACDNGTIEKNTKKYFNSDLGSIITELSRPPQAVVTATDPLSSLFIQPMENRDHKQCLSPMGNGFMDMVTKGSMQSRVTNEVATEILRHLNKEKTVGWILERHSLNNDYFRKLPDVLKQEIVMRMKQLKTVGKSDDEIKAAFSKLAFSDTAIEGAIDNLQNHCGFMMTSLVDLMCQKKEVGDIASNKFIEKQLGHDPYEVDLEDENWYAAQEMHCRSELSQSKEKDKNESCVDNYRKDVTELIIPPIRLTSYDSLLACNKEFVGSDNYLKNSNMRREKTDNKSSKDGTAGICEMLACSNHIDMITGEEVVCEKRNGNLSYKDLINEIASINCSKESNKYCQNGKALPILENIQKMFITECRITGCMEDKVLAGKFQDQIKTNPDLKRIFETPKEKLVSMSGAEQQFWDRFSGETTVMAQSDSFNVDSYSKVLDKDFTGKGYKEKPAVTPKDVIADVKNEAPPVVNVQDQAKQAIEQLEHKKRVQEESHALMDEVEINRSLQRQLKQARRDIVKVQTNDKHAVITSAVRQARDIVSQNKKIYEQIRSMREERLRRAGKKVSSTSFEERYKDQLAGINEFVSNGINIAPKRKTSSNDNSEARDYKNVLRDNRYSQNQNFQGSQNSVIKPLEVAKEAQVDNAKALPKRMGKGGSIASPDEINKIGASGSSAGASGTSSGSPSTSKARASSGVKLGSLGGESAALGQQMVKEAIDAQTLVKGIRKETIISVEDEVEEIDIVNEVINYKKVNPEFKVGGVVVLKQGESEARLIPLFDKFGYFSSYGINSDKDIRDRIVIRSEGPIMMRFMGKNESLKHELDIATLKVSAN
jgi:hypothetical protein